jgi:polyribonucleotide nucleotidyltransferase
MDIKIKNVSAEVMTTALEQAKRGRMHILDKMAEAIQQPQEELSVHAPRIVTFTVDPDAVVCSSVVVVKTVRSIQEKFGVQVNFDDGGVVTIYSKDKAAADNAKQSFMQLLEEPEIGSVYPEWSSESPISAPSSSFSPGGKDSATSARWPTTGSTRSKMSSR